MYGTLKLEKRFDNAVIAAIVSTCFTVQCCFSFPSPSGKFKRVRALSPPSRIKIRYLCIYERRMECAMRLELLKSVCE